VLRFVLSRFGQTVAVLFMASVMAMKCSKNLDATSS